MATARSNQARIGSVAARNSSSVWFGVFISTAVAGAGFGLAFLGTFRTLVALATPTARGALVAVIYVVAYLAFAIPAVIAGYTASHIGLHTTAVWYGTVVGFLTLLGVTATWRTTAGSAI